MDDVRKKIAYLQGLAVGLKLDEGKEEAKIIKQLIDVVADVADEVEDLHAAQEDVEEYLESIDDDLYGEDGEDECDCEECDEEKDEQSCELEDDVDYVEVECPKCHDIICFEEELLDSDKIFKFTCPHCNEVVYKNDGSMPRPKKAQKAICDEDEGPEDI